MAAPLRTDEELAGAAGSGDEQAFAEIYERYSTPLYDFACRLLRNRADAGDVVQVTMTNAWRNLSRRRSESKLKPWLFSIAHNAAMDVIRRRRPADPIDESEEEGYAIPSSHPHVGAGVEAAELANDVWAAAAALSPTEYAVLHHELRTELRPDEIAEVTGMARGAVYTALSRARASFEEAFTLLQLGRQGRAECRALDALLSGAAPRTLDKKTRRVVKAHLADCDLCTENSRRFVAPGMLFSTIPPIAAPDDLFDLTKLVEQARGEREGSGRGAQRVRSFGSPRFLIPIAAAVVGVALVAGLLLAGDDADEVPSAATANSSDLVPPEDPTDVVSTTHVIGRASSERVVMMSWSPAEGPASADGESSGIAGYSHSWTGEQDSIPPDEPTLGPSDTGIASSELTDGEWWFHLRTFDRAGNSTSTVHVGPFVIAGRVRIVCEGTSAHPYWLENPVGAVVLLRDGVVRISISSTPEGSGFLSDAAATGSLQARGRSDDGDLSLVLEPSKPGAQGSVQAEQVSLRALSEDGRSFYVFRSCRLPASD